MKRTMVVVCASLTWAAAAWSEPKTAAEWFKEGSTQYNLGDFEKAAEAFKQAFSLESDDAKKPAYLYNVAQAYRQEQKCKDAVFFYRRFISLKDSGMGKALTPETRAKTEELIAEAEQCAKQGEALAQKKPDTTMPPDGGGTGSATGTGGGSSTVTMTGSAGSGAGSGSGSGAKATKATKVASHDDGDGDEDDEGVHKTATGGAPRLISARVLVGPAITETGGLSIPVETTVTVIAGYPLKLAPQITLDLGAAVTFTPVPYQNNSNPSMVTTDTASFTEILANGGITYAVTPKIAARGDLGLGALMFSGIAAGSPFTENGAATTGALGMFALRVSASVDYAITNNIIATAAPLTLSYSPAISGLANNIKSFARVDVLVGLGYRM